MLAVVAVPIWKCSRRGAQPVSETLSLSQCDKIVRRAVLLGHWLCGCVGYKKHSLWHIMAHVFVMMIDVSKHNTYMTYMEACLGVLWERKKKTNTKLKQTTNGQLNKQTNTPTNTYTHSTYIERNNQRSNLFIQPTNKHIQMKWTNQINTQTNNQSINQTSDLPTCHVKQTNKQTNNGQTKQTNKHTNKQRN